MGLDVAKSFLLVLLSLVVIGVTVLIVLNAMADSGAVSDKEFVTVTNETGAYINSTGYTFTNQGVGTINVLEARNASDGTVIGSGNYTVTDGQLFNATATTYSDVNVDYEYQVYTETGNVINNASEGTSEFFTNTGTWLSLLAIVIVILIISTVIFVVNRFGGGSKPSL